MPLRNTPDSMPNLAQAILLMTQELRRHENPAPKAKKPDIFDGSDPQKLNSFILQCNLYFRNSTTHSAYSAFSDDSEKINFALSYLRGTALEYFEPSILDSDEISDWMDSWSAFSHALRTQFGPIDPTADAENGIDNLKMLDSQHIVKYNVKFNCLAIRTGWDDNALRHHYYSGLAERIKDIMSQQGKPETLEAMKTLAHAIDSRHWERLHEKSRSGNSAHNSENSDYSNFPTPPTPLTPLTPPKPNPTPSDFSDKPRKPLSSISDKLGKDGKLTAQERQYRFDNNLCMYCGGIGHIAKECPKSLAKAHAAQLKENSDPISDNSDSDSDISDSVSDISNNSDVSDDSDSENSDSNHSINSDSDISDSEDPNSNNSDSEISEISDSNSDIFGESDSGNSDSRYSDSGNSDSEHPENSDFENSEPENSDPDSDSDDSGSDSE